MKRAKFEKPHIYRRKGNEEQAIFNSCLDEIVAEAETELIVVEFADPGMFAKRSVDSRRAIEADSYCESVGAWVGSSGGIYG